MPKKRDFSLCCPICRNVMREETSPSEKKSIFSLEKEVINSCYREMLREMLRTDENLKELLLNYQQRFFLDDTISTCVLRTAHYTIMTLITIHTVHYCTQSNSALCHTVNYYLH